MVIVPKPSRGKRLNLLFRFKQVLSKPVIPHGAVIALNVGVLLRFAGLDVFNPDIVLFGLMSQRGAEVFRAVVTA